ncbi:glycosyltransferase family 1 protein [Diaporthe eres]|uniref:UDP-N-acetylglucosamine transferase subunit ALG13 n=2 Tax=Diaporthe vaccinii TaxID=105482 RepID=A0ABR4DU18_9PEZI|nr:glycosyltransferase family 1 protein [Diaporthe eres]
MPKKVKSKKVKGVQRPARLRKLKKAAQEAAKVAAAANSPELHQVDSQDSVPEDGSVSDAEAQSINPNERERFKRVIRLPLHIDDETMGRRLLVTGGATVPFVALLEEATGEDFLQVLRDHGFTHVYLQCGAAHDQIEARLKGDSRGDAGLQVETFAFCRDLKSLIKEHCRGEKGVRPAGVVIGHAGTGTISDTMEVDCALVIVANTTLMDDHQSAFAAEMASEYPTIVQAHLGNIAKSIPEIMAVIKKNGLDDLEPYEEPSLPDEQQLTFIDEVVAGATRPQSYYGIRPLHRCIVQ